MKKLLLVDDTPANLGVLMEVLHSAGFRLLVADSGERALHQTALGRPDLILLDVMMPVIDGFETCRRLKADPGLADIPVIFVTALDAVEHKVRAFEVGAVDYVTKPLQPAEVLARVRLHLHLRDLQAALTAKNDELADRNEQLDAALQRRLLAERALTRALDRALVVTARDGTIVFCSAPAADLLARHFPGTATTRLPPPLVQGGSLPGLKIERTPTAAGDGIMWVLAEDAAAPSPHVLLPLGLTPREAEVLFWIAQGKTSPEIATITGIAVNTVKKHVQNLLVKLGVETRLAAALRAMEVLGLSPPAGGR